MLKNRFTLGSIVFVCLIVGLVGHEVASAGTSRSPEPTSFVLEEVSVVDPLVENDIPTTTTTVDLSWLNTTTTTTRLVRHAAEAAVEPNYDPGDGSRWDQLAQCESGGNWSTNTGNGYGGGLQFAHQSSWSTWRAFGGEEFSQHPWEATREQQIIVAERVLERSGWGAWPGCTRKFGWR